MKILNESLKSWKDSKAYDEVLVALDITGYNGRRGMSDEELEELPIFIIVDLNKPEDEEVIACGLTARQAVEKLEKLQPYETGRYSVYAVDSIEYGKYNFIAYHENSDASDLKRIKNESRYSDIMRAIDDAPDTEVDIWAGHRRYALIPKGRNIWSVRRV